jgi:hypothetical protein
LPRTRPIEGAFDLAEHLDVKGPLLQAFEIELEDERLDSGCEQVRMWLAEDAALTAAGVAVLLGALSQLRQTSEGANVESEIDALGEEADFYLAHVLESG